MASDCFVKIGRKEEEGGGGVALYVKENLECVEVDYSNCGSPVECFGVKIRGVVSKEESYSRHLLPTSKPRR